MEPILSWPPGWFPDPTGRHDHRWWDGATWTAHVADAGVVAPPDPLPVTPPGMHAAATSRRRIRPAGGAAPRSNDPVAVGSLAVGIGAIPLVIIPGLGLVLPITALVLGLVGRNRVRSGARGGAGLAVAGLVLGSVTLVLAVIVSTVTVALLSGSGGEVGDALRAYMACLEVSSPGECRAILEESLAAILG